MTYAPGLTYVPPSVNSRASSTASVSSFAAARTAVANGGSPDNVGMRTRETRSPGEGSMEEELESAEDQELKRLPPAVF